MFPLLAPLLGAAGTAVASKLIDRGVDKVTGVPTPTEDKSGRQHGQEHLDFLDTAFPGTTPWERLGSGASANPVQAAESEKKNAMKLQDREFTQQQRITLMNNRASIISALGGVSPMAARSGLELLESGSGSEYDTRTSQDREKLADEVENIRASARRSHAESEITPHRNPWVTMMGALNRGHSDEARLEARLRRQDQVRKIREFVTTRGRGVKRFGARVV